MENNIKINFENYLNKKNFSSSQKEIKESNFNNFIKNGFPNKRIEDWKFSDLKQIITTNFENIDFSKKEEQSNIEENFTFDLRA
jgi:Fe-S cluster assembly protein SufD